MSDFTQGEWKAAMRSSDYTWQIYSSAAPLAIAVVNDYGVPRETVEANARLLAAAPDLLEACQGLLHALAAMNASDHPELKSDINAARAAIAKAKGGAS